MTARSEDIVFLQEFRDWVDEYLFLGFAPSQNDWKAKGMVMAVSKVQKDPKYVDLRRRIVQAKSKAKKLFTECGIAAIRVDYPAPAVGGPIFESHLLDLIVENTGRKSIEKATFLDRIDEAIGVLQGMPEAVSPVEQCDAEGTPHKKVFIGHGQSVLWRELKDFIQDRLQLQWDEFNRESAAGVLTGERLLEMLNNASFAFLILTADDEHVDNTLHARENVIHEAGLFQGKLGFRRAIVLLEEGCTEFSNITGLGQIRFPKGNVSAAFEEVRSVLEREGVLPEVN